jgi:ATP-dependent DNA ligase
MTSLRWVKPKIVVEVSFVEWTRDGLLRHPEFVGLRTDKKTARRHARVTLALSGRASAARPQNNHQQDGEHD